MKILSNRTNRRWVLFYCLAMLSTQHVHAQTKHRTTITIDRNEITLNELLSEIRRQSGYDFVFTSSKLDFNKKVSPKFKNTDLIQVLNHYFNANAGVFYIFKNKTIILLDEEKAEYKLIQGTVIDHISKQPVVGASVSINEKRIATKTDAKGNFTLNIPEYAKELYISNLGFNSQIVPVTPSVRYAVELTEKSEGLDEVVVTGIVNRDVKNFTGSSVNISAQELKKVSAQNVFAAISAYDPSFRIVPNNIAGGNINRLPDIQIRGQNSFPNLTGELSNNPNAPLFILDGFEVSLQRIMDLDMNLIANITLLKDASATAIYGSRGANGIMVVSTILPKPGKLQLTVNNDFGVTTPILSVYNLLNAQEKLDFERRAGIYESSSAQYQHKLDVLYSERYKAMLSGVNTDWLKIPTKVGYNNRTSLYVQGGDETLRYGVQVNSDFQNGVMKGQNRTNYAGQFDLNYRVNKLQFRNSLRIFQNKSNESPYGGFQNYVKQNPYWNPYDQNGNPKKLLEDYEINLTAFQQPNPLYDATLNTKNQTEYFGFSNNFTARYAPTANFYVESNISINRQKSSSDQFYPAEHSMFLTVDDINRRGQYTARNDNNFSYESLTTANYSLVKGRNQWFSTLAFNIASAQTDYYSVTAEGFPYQKLDNLLFAAQYQANSRPSGDESTVNRMGFVYSGSYTYDNRFLTDVSIRRDGSSQYGADRRFGTFWSTGIGWNIHNEQFLKDNPYINRLKLRASYGATGSMNVPAYSAQSRYSFGVGTSYYGELGGALMGLGNTDLTWQNVLKSNLGIDAELFRNILSLRFDYYVENTRDAITTVTLAPSTGFSSYNENMGKIQNRGFEFSARLKLIEDKSKGFLWAVNVNGFTNKNILKEISNRLKASNDRFNADNTEQIYPNIVLKEGQSTNTIFVVRSLGIDPATGSEVFLTKDGQRTYSWNVADKVPFGISQPKWNGNFGTNLMYKGFEMNLLFNYQFGGQLYNSTLIDRVENVDAKLNVDRRAYDLGWKGEGDVSLYKRITATPTVTQLTSRFVQDDNNLILSSASLGYNFYKNQWIKRLGFRSLQVSAITNDLFRISSIQIERGTSNPFARTYSLSLRAGF
ncbi:SusC/RagA family TonB-linked outer membrane protein [Sphingobacterium siyangense]|uniref:SusC/RagA family TonB-linked outer membrane protein n=1 Tax=Sphingobacterium siyangense TaxID=459529 RepID=UPI0030197BB0